MQAQNVQRQAAMVEQQKQMKDQILSQALSLAARSRLSNIALVKPDRAEQIENMIIRQVQTGQIRQQIQEEQIIQFLSQVSEQSHKPKIQIQRKVYDDDDDFKNNESEDSSDDDW